jgi:hypothetical protein
MGGKERKRGARKKKKDRKKVKTSLDPSLVSNGAHKQRPSKVGGGRKFGGKWDEL